MKPTNITFAALLSASLLWAGEDADLRISGFGTLGAVYNDNSDYLYRPRMTTLNGSDGNLDFKSDSLLGLQADYRISDRLSLGLQGIVRFGDENDPSENKAIDPSLEWAYLKYSPMPGVDFRIGRLREPSYYYSESYHVGYAYPWVRLPLEVYSMIPFNSHDGVDVTYRGVSGDYFYQLRGMFGQSRAKLKLGGGVEFKSNLPDQYGIIVSGGTGSFQLRLNFLKGRIDPESNPFGSLISALSQTPYASVGEALEFDGKSAGYRSVGFSYNPGNLEVLGEFGRVDGGSAAQQYSSWFLYAGYRLGDFLPYLTYGSSEYVEDDALSPNPIPDNGPLAPLHAALNQTLEGSDISQSSWTVGVRYDVQENMALKFQYDRISLDNGVSNLILPLSPRADGDINVFSAALHFVF